jgi:hypothetical protein
VIGKGFLRIKQKTEARKEIAIAANVQNLSSSLIPLALLMARNVSFGIGKGITELGGNAQ